jgi:NAD(P)-dependent dehydrogenase (short-subunit alcohol dehydrogenase family)
MHSLARFDLTGRVAVITGGAGLLGRQHAAAIEGAGGIAVLADLDGGAAEQAAGELEAAHTVVADVTDHDAVCHLRDEVLRRFGRMDVLINNAARNPKVGSSGLLKHDRLEGFDLTRWEQDLAVGLTGAFLCSQVIGTEMARQGRGVILNVASDLALIGPDQRIYQEPGLPSSSQPVKPVSYSVIKAGLLGLTRYLATYWADAGVRVNAISPGGVEAGQPEAFVEKLTNLIPLGRMAHKDEYREAIVFLCSDASSYMTGQNLVIDGGRTAW